MSGIFSSSLSSMALVCFLERLFALSCLIGRRVVYLVASIVSWTWLANHFMHAYATATIALIPDFIWSADPVINLPMSCNSGTESDTSNATLACMSAAAVWNRWMYG